MPKSGKVQITVPEDKLTQWRGAAESAGLSLSSWIIAQVSIARSLGPSLHATRTNTQQLLARTRILRDDVDAIRHHLGIIYDDEQEDLQQETEPRERG